MSCISVKIYKQVVNLHQLVGVKTNFEGKNERYLFLTACDDFENCLASSVFLLQTLKTNGLVFQFKIIHKRSCLHF